MAIPIIDPNVKFMGVSGLRILNSTFLRELHELAIVIQENSEPLTVIVSYKTFLKMQKLIKEKEEPK